MSERTTIRRSAVAVGCAGLAVLATSGAAVGATKHEAQTKMTLAYVTAQAHPYGIVVDQFIKDVAAASNGRIEITGRPLYPQAEPLLLKDVQAGTVQMGTISTAVWDQSGVAAFQALQAPFLVDNYGLESKIIGGSTGRRMLAAATRASGTVVLALAEGGLRKPVGTKPLNTVASFKGAVIRAPQSGVLKVGLQALGADASPIPLPEVYTSLRNGTVTGMEANLGLIWTNKYYEVAKYVTGNLNLWPFPHAITINRTVWNGLSAADKQALRTAAAKVPAYSIAVVTKKSNLPQNLVNCGVKFINASPAEKAKFQALGRKAYATLGKDAVTKRYIAEIQAIKSKFTPKPPVALPTRATGSCDPNAT